MRRRCCSLAVGAALILLGVLPDTSAAQGGRPGRSGTPSSFHNGHGNRGHAHHGQGHHGHRGHGHRGHGTVIVGPPFFGSPFYGSPFYASTTPLYTPPVVYYNPAPAYYPPPQAYAPAPAYAPPAPTAPPVVWQDVQPATREVVFSSGRWVLQGDGMAVPYRWVWIPNAPTAPPPGTSSPVPEAERHVYAWTDAAGVTTYTDRLSKVPPEHRSTARRDP